MDGTMSQTAEERAGRCNRAGPNKISTNVTIAEVIRAIQSYGPNTFDSHFMASEETAQSVQPQPRS